MEEQSQHSITMLKSLRLDSRTNQIKLIVVDLKKQGLFLNLDLEKNGEELIKLTLNRLEEISAVKLTTTDETDTAR